MANARWSQPHEAREETFEEIVGRFKDDRKGEPIARGVTYSSDGEHPWSVRHSTRHADQFDVVCDGRTVATAGKRRLPTRFIRKRAREDAATCRTDLTREKNNENYS
jgi:hypothetical protein